MGYKVCMGYGVRVAGIMGQMSKVSEMRSVGDFFVVRLNKFGTRR